MSASSPSKRPLITGMGAALVDLFADVDDATLENLGSPKGSMTLVDPPRAAELSAGVDIHTHRPGGSAANTVAGLAGLGMAGGFIGKVGDDALGQIFTASMTDLGVTFPVTPCDASVHPTGNCLVLVTPDAERTMHTLLGASVTTASEDLRTDMLDATGILFCEGYVCDIDILLANTAEATTLLGVDQMDDVVTAMHEARVDGAITSGPEGAVIVSGDEVVSVPARAVDKVVDLTGAGDQFAAGYLCGVATGRDPETCGTMGALAASEVIQHFGPRPEAGLIEVFAANGLPVS